MPVAETQPVGGDLHASYNSATNATPTWVEMTRIENLSYQDSLNMSGTKFRGQGWEKEIPGKFKIGISCTYQRTRAADTVYAALRTKYLAKTPVQIALADRPMNETPEGTKAYYLIKKMDESQDIEGAWQTQLEFGPAEFVEAAAVIDPVDL